jgi:hypothetical protein
MRATALRIRDAGGSHGALATSDAEARWLGGEDIFKNIQRDDEKSGESMDSNPQFQAIYNAAFAA